MAQKGYTPTPGFLSSLRNLEKTIPYTSSTQLLSSTTTIQPNDRYVLVSSTSTITVTNNPAIATGVNGQILTVFNTGSFAITLQSGLGSSVTLKPGAYLEVVYINTLSRWIPANSSILSSLLAQDIDTSNITSGILPLARGGTGGTSIDASNITLGILPLARGGTGGTSIDASNITLGNLAIARGGTAASNIDAARLNFGITSPSENELINGGFAVGQQGGSFSLTNTGYTLDSWYWTVGPSGGSFASGTISQQSFTPGTLTGEPAKYLRINNTTTTGLSPSVAAVLSQRINDVRTLSGGPCTISFWARSSYSKRIVVGLLQSFNETVSSSNAISGSSFNLTTTWTKYVANFEVPSISGRTIASTSFLQLDFWMQAGSDFSSRTGVGTSFGWGGTGTVEIADVKLEPGNVATPFQKRPIFLEGALCQLYYQRMVVSARFSATAGLQVHAHTLNFQIMAKDPRATLISQGLRSNLQQEPVFTVYSNNSARIDIFSLTSGDTFTVNEVWGLDAGLWI